MKYAMLFILAMLTGCMQDGPNKIATDQCQRAVLLQQCLTAVPHGPSTTVAENPWDKIINECSSYAYRTSLRLASTIKPECIAY